MNTQKMTCWIAAICIMVFGLASFTFADSLEDMAKKEGKLIF